MQLKIYYLDDEPDLLEMFSELFSSSDYEITTFSDPGLAISTVQTSPPDLLIVDFRLPNCTGDEVAQKVDSKIPKALITGDIQVKSNYKFDVIFEKPYKTAQIEEFLKSLKNKKSL